MFINIKESKRGKNRTLKVNTQQRKQNVKL